MTENPQELVFLKLGGSLITDKEKPQSPRLTLIKDLVRAIADALADVPKLQLLLGHGSGSYGHVPAKKYGTRQGVRTAREWLGFAEVWYQASALNHLVIEACHLVGLPAISFPLSAGAVTADKEILSWDLHPLHTALNEGLLPVVFGDVVVDRKLGGTILSTEAIFLHLAGHLKPTRILLAGEEPGVWANFPATNELLPVITPADRAFGLDGVQGAVDTDVTGGMFAKVHQMLSLIENYPEISVQIFSGKFPEHVKQAIRGQPHGTTLKALI
jgi:isopentenyl phosphate kinase